MKYDYIIWGATFYGCGMAACLKGNVLVLEESVVPGSDWALSFARSTWEEPLTTRPAIDYKDALISHKALTEDGRLCIAALAPLMAQWCIDHGVRIAFSCNVVSHDGASVSVIGPGGPRQYETEHFIDARPRIFNGRKYVTALIRFEDAPLSPGMYGPFILTPSSVEGEYYLALPMQGTKEWPEARAAFHDAWNVRHAALEKAQLQLIGVQFDYGNAPNPAAAMEYGFLWARDVLN